MEVQKNQKIFKKINKFFLEEILILLDLKMKYNNFNKDYLPYRKKLLLSDKVNNLTLKLKKIIYIMITK